MRTSRLFSVLFAGLLVVSHVAAADPPPIEFRVGPFASDARDWMSEALVSEPALATLGGGKIPEALSIVEVDTAGKEIGSSPAQLGPDTTPWKSAENRLKSVAWRASGVTTKG